MSAPQLYPAFITIFCDRCGTEHSGDYLVSETDAPATRHGYARTHLRAQGWRCDENGDLCPGCLGA